ncbi:glycoside hydrolase family 3 protein [Diplodia corticola]|uniref:beta-glucosidase n=1 Tax=Diplodia corticola TaxID=236234 RepID=A0A1J9RIQ3_9PEZI|nr:glycoside hydrolase family 3 protein [Diplodia corticola]OJD40528.1 glycoside hydrolase family 3 protein [Diplodia corticola]
MVSSSAAVVAAAVIAGAAAQNVTANGTAPLYKNPSAPVEDRVQDLLSRMTVQEKVAQLIQGDITNFINQTTGEFNASGLVWNMEWRAGQIWTGYPIPQQTIAEAGKIAQDYLLHNTTLGIPALLQNEGIHGGGGLPATVSYFNSTIFNSPIAHACSFNPDLVRDMADVIAQEALALGINQIFAPVVDLARELRFGRVEETYGEDPYLAGEMGYAYVRGLEARNVSAMVKHFAGFSNPEQGLNTGPVHGGERELRTTWLPPFHRAIIDAGATSVMSAYHSWDGVPAVADYHTLTEILREEWGYEYYVSSDAGGTDRLCKNFKMCKADPMDKEAVTMYALPAGNDVEMGGGSYNFETIIDLVASGRLDMDTVDTAVARTLRTKFVLGIFENPYRAVAANETALHIHTAQSVALARKLDAESIVLLENKESVLPLDPAANIAVIGPMADFMNYGDYVVQDSQYRGVTPLAGIKAASSGGTVTYALGAERWSNDESGFAEAVAAAEAADVAVVVVGTWSRDQTELWQGLNATTGEHVDVHSLRLVGAQNALVRAVVATGRPTVVVFQSGKPVTEPWISGAAAAVVQQFYPSEQGGAALADVLFGAHNPSGKLAVGIPHDVGTTPVFYDYLNSGRSVDAGAAYDNGTLLFGHQYVLSTPQPLYPFGHGKSYADFAYSNVSLSRPTAGPADVVTASVRLTNNSTRDGQEVVQLYVSDLIASVAVPNMQLRGFKKVLVKAGESVDVAIDVDVSKLGVWDIRMKYVVEPGEFAIYVGSSSADLRGNATLTVV